MHYTHAQEAIFLMTAITRSHAFGTTLFDQLSKHGFSSVVEGIIALLHEREQVCGPVGVGSRGVHDSSFFDRFFALELSEYIHRIDRRGKSCIRHGLQNDFFQFLQGSSHMQRRFHMVYLVTCSRIWAILQCNARAELASVSLGSGSEGATDYSCSEKNALSRRSSSSGCSSAI